MLLDGRINPMGNDQVNTTTSNSHTTIRIASIPFPSPRHNNPNSSQSCTLSTRTPPTPTLHHPLSSFDPTLQIDQPPQFKPPLPPSHSPFPSSSTRSPPFTPSPPLSPLTPPPEPVPAPNPTISFTFSTTGGASPSVPFSEGDTKADFAIAAGLAFMICVFW